MALRALGHRGGGRDREVDGYCHQQGALERGAQEAVGSVHRTGGKWMELENIILREVSLAQKTKNRMFSLICGH
jgi:hypothetical protein